VEEIKYFFSYAREDSAFVLRLAKELRRAGANLWLDQLDILGGQRWDRAVQEALDACQGIIAVLSPEALASNNVMDEVSYALEEGKLVVPILLRSCAVPFRLRRVQYIDFIASYDAALPQLLRALRIDHSPEPSEPAATDQPTVATVNALDDAQGNKTTGRLGEERVDVEVRDDTGWSKARLRRFSVLLVVGCVFLGTAVQLKYGSTADFFGYSSLLWFAAAGYQLVALIISWSLRHLKTEPRRR